MKMKNWFFCALVFLSSQVGFALTAEDLFEQNRGRMRGTMVATGAECSFAVTDNDINSEGGLYVAVGVRTIGTLAMLTAWVKWWHEGGGEGMMSYSDPYGHAVDFFYNGDFKVTSYKVIEGLGAADTCVLVK